MYKQIFGSPMGSPISPVIAGLVMEFVESSVLNSIDFQPLFFYRYVDDIITAIPKNKIDTLLYAFNSFNKHIKFTLELENNCRLPFLDLLIIHQDDGTLITDLYHKATWSGRYLNFLSHLPISYKSNTITLLTNKILQLSDPIFHYTNFKLLFDTLICNNYPPQFIKYNIKRAKYKQIICQTEKTSNMSYVSIPYVNKLFEKIKACLCKYNIQVVGRAYNNFQSSIFSSLKDKTAFECNTNVVYEVICSCGSRYIGNTKQLLKKRIYQHKNDAAKLFKDNTNIVGKSALSTHLYERQHNIHLDDVKILARASNDQKRAILEMIHIKRNKHNIINKQSDSDYIQNTYNSLI